MVPNGTIVLRKSAHTRKSAYPLKFKISIVKIFRGANPPSENLMSSPHKNNILVNPVIKIVDFTTRVDFYVIKMVSFGFKRLHVIMCKI